MAKTELLQVRIDAEVKKEAAQILESLGTTLSASINMYLKQIIIQRGIPFKVVIPDTQESINNNVDEQAVQLKQIKIEKDIKEIQIPKEIEQPKIIEEEKKEAIVQKETNQIPVILSEQERKELKIGIEPKTKQDIITEQEKIERYNRMFSD